MLKYFKISEFDCPSLPGSGQKMNMGFLELLDTLREKAGFPFVISSGYRTPEYNAKVSFTGLEGPHTTGMAADILCNAEQAYVIVRLAIEHDIPRIGISQKGDKRFVHLDILFGEKFKKCIWTY